MDISVRTRHDLKGEDQRWIGNAGLETLANVDIVLDRSKFTAGTHYPNGFIPSGMALGKVTATGLYGPYGASPSEVQTLTRTSTGGTITLTFDGETTGDIAATAAGFTASAVSTALLGLSNINTGDVTVTGDAGGPLTVTFGGQYLGKNVSELVVDNTNATGGTVTVATTTQGGGSVSDGREVLAGFLYKSVVIDEDSTANPAGALFRAGEVITNYLPANNGLDAAGRADVDKHIVFTTLEV